MKIKYKYYLINFLIALPMTIVMAFGNLAIFQGFTESFLAGWFRATWIGLLISYPSTLIIVPIAQRVVEKINWR